MFDVYQLDIFTYWALLHDAIVTTNAQTEEGRKWLHDAWRIQQTTPDAEKLHQNMAERRVTRGSEIRGITVTINGDTTGLGKALDTVKRRALA